MELTGSLGGPTVVEWGPGWWLEACWWLQPARGRWPQCGGLVHVAAGLDPAAGLPASFWSTVESPWESSL